MPLMALISASLLPTAGKGTRILLPRKLGAPGPKLTSSSSSPDNARIVEVVALLKGSNGFSDSLIIQQFKLTEEKYLQSQYPNLHRDTAGSILRLSAVLIHHIYLRMLA